VLGRLVVGVEHELKYNSKTNNKVNQTTKPKKKKKNKTSVCVVEQYT